jgi:hypothetical protein
MKNLMYFSLFIFVILSCKKENTIRVRAVNPVTGDGYAHLDFTVRSGKTGAFGDNYTTEYTGTLNENGEAIFNLKLSSGKSYRLFMQKPDNTCYQNITDYVMKKDGLNMLAQFEYAPCAYLKWRIENINCEGASDKIKVYYLGRQVGGQEPPIIGALIREGDGCYFFESNDFNEVPMGERYYRREVTRNGITEIFHDTIYLNAGEFYTYEINY